MTEPIFRFENYYEELTDGLQAPNFPIRSGLSLHSYTTEKYGYTITSRMYGTTRFNYEIKNIQKDDYDDLQHFWESTIFTGYEDMTIIDNKGRMLFESSWLTWRATWSKRNGGTYTIYIDIESSVPWTLPCLAAWTFANNDVDEYTKDNDNLTLDSGVLVDYATDTAINRAYGSALKLTGDSGTSQLTGGTCPINWKHCGDQSITIFCQFKPVSISGDRVIIAQATNSSGSLDFTLWQTTTQFGGRVNDSYVGTEDGTFHVISTSYWYDAAITYDAHNDTTYVYIVRTDTSGSFTHFLDGAADLIDGIGSYMIASPVPSINSYTTVNLLKDDTINGATSGQSGYLQNVFFFNGFLSPMDFNTMRRLCYMWNSKTEMYPK